MDAIYEALTGPCPRPYVVVRVRVVPLERDFARSTLLSSPPLFRSHCEIVCCIYEARHFGQGVQSHTGRNIGPSAMEYTN